MLRIREENLLANHMPGVLGLALLVMGVVLPYVAPLSREVLYPAPDVQIVKVTDSLSGGNSWSRIDPQISGVGFRYGLGDSAQYPFAGFKLVLKANLAKTKALEVKMKADSGVALRLFLKSPAKELGRPKDGGSFFYHEVEYAPFGADTLKKLPIGQFHFPTWWRIRENWPAEKEFARLSDVREIEILSGYEQMKKDSVTGELHSLVALNPVPWVGVLSWMAVVAGVLLISYSFLRHHLKKRQGVALSQGLKPVTLHRSGDLPMLCLNHLKEHYSNSEYSLETLAKGVATSERQASEALRVATGLHFKAALNELRLMEAQRLLLQSEASVSEIAFAVGFNNHAHFTRAFKSKFGKSPSELREEHK